MPSQTPPEASAYLIGQIQRRQLPLTKASCVRVMFAPDDQEFSLDAEIEAEVPADLPGKMPTSLRDLYPVKSSSSPASTTTAAASRSAPTAKASLEEAPAAKQASSSGKLKTLEGSKMPFKPGPGREQRLTGRIQASGKPLNKATWIEAMTDYKLPSFTRPRVSLPAPAAPRSSAASRRRAAGSDDLPSAGASSTWHASPAGLRFSPAAAEDS